VKRWYSTNHIHPDGRHIIVARRKETIQFRVLSKNWSHG
jgi:hypothetical protein